MQSFLPGFKVAALAAASAVTVAGLAMATPAQAADKDTIGFSALSMANRPLAGLAKGVEGVGAAKGYNTVIFDPNFDPITQAQQLTQAINAGTINAAWVLSIAPEVNADVAKLAQEKGVPIVFNGVPKDYGFSGPQKGLTFATLPYAKIARTMGLNGGKCIKKKLGGNSQIIMLVNPAGWAGKAEQESAVKKSLKKTAPNAKIVEVVVQSDLPKTQKAISSALRRFPGVTSVVGGTSESTTAALNAFKAAGKSKQLKCVTMWGGSNPVIDAALKKGAIYANAEVQFEADLMQTFDEIDRLLANPSATGRLLSVPVKVVRGGNADE